MTDPHFYINASGISLPLRSAFAGVNADGPQRENPPWDLVAGVARESALAFDEVMGERRKDQQAAEAEADARRRNRFV